MRKLAIFSFSFSVAVFLCNYLLPQKLWLAASAVSGLLFLSCHVLRKGRSRLRACIICAGLAVGFFWIQAYDMIFFEPARKLDDQTIRLTAVVEDYPRQRDYGWQVSARMKTETETNLKLVLYLDDQGENLRPGDRIESVTHCTLGAFSAAGEEITYYTAKGVFLWGRCYGTLNIQRPESIPIRYWPAHLAYLLKGSINEVFPSERAGIVEAVVTGSREKLTDEFTSSLERTGLSHTVAVSGMHLSCFAGVLAILLGRGRKSTALIVIAWSLLFCGVAGNTPSVSRAAVMIILLQIAPLLLRERDDPTALGFALMLLLFWNPYSAAHIGLQLSFAAVAGICFLSHRFQNAAFRRFHLLGKAESQGEYFLRRLAQAVLSVISTTLGAMVATIPLTAIHFGMFSLIAPVTNLLTLWAVTGVFALGLVLGLVGLVVPELAQMMALPVSWLAEYVQWSSSVFSGFAFSALSLENGLYRLWLVFSYAVLIGLLLTKGKRRYIIPVGCVAVTLVSSIVSTALLFERNDMTVVALDVGQGQSILLRCGEKLTLVDCGGDAPDNAGDLAADYIQSRGQHKLDFLVLTHFHGDHANGVQQLLRRIQVNNLLVPDVEPDNPLRQEILALAEKLEVAIRFIRQDTCIDFAENARIMLYPPLTQGDPNEAGLTALVTSGDFDVLVTGDMNGETEQLLLDEVPLPDVELLVAGHHGSKQSTTQELLEEINPEICMISVGAHNNYGHPAKQVLERLSAIGAEIYRTDQHGTVTVTSNGN